MTMTKSPEVTKYEVIWRARYDGREILIDAEYPVSWHDARKFAQQHFGDFTDEVVLEAVGEVSHKIRWTGSDAGVHPNRRMQVRTGGKAWRDL
jgi:hypothetical protein